MAPDIVPSDVEFNATEGIAGVPSDATAFFLYLRNVSGIISNASMNGSVSAEGSLMVQCRDPASGKESLPASSSFVVTNISPLLQEDPSEFPILINTTVPVGQSIFQFNFEYLPNSISTVDVS